MAKRLKDAYKAAMQMAKPSAEELPEAESTEAEEKEKEAVLPVPETAEENAEAEEGQEAAEENAEAEEGQEAAEEEPETENGAEGGDDTDDLREEIRRLTEENESLKEAIRESGKRAGEKIAELAEPPEGAVEAVDEYPSLDMTAIMYGSPEDSSAAQNAFAAGILRLIEERAKPILSKRDEAKRYADRENAVRVLSGMDEMKGFADMRGDLDELIARNAMLSAHENPMEQYITAYLIKKGVEAIAKEGKEPELEELMAMYHGNESFRDEIEKERLEALKQHANVPPSPIGTGLSAVEPHVAKAPKTMAEAAKNTRKMFGK